MPPVAEFGIDDPPVSEGFGESDPAVETFGENDLSVTASQTGEEAPAPTDSPNVAGAKAAWEALNKPFVAVPRVTGAELKRAYPFLSETSSEFIAGTQRGVAGLIEGVENPLGAAVGVAGVGAKFGMTALMWMAKTGAAAYAALMAKHLPEGAAETEVAFQQKDWERGMEMGIGTAASAVLVPVIAGHLAPRGTPRPLVPFIEETSRATGAPIVPRGAVQEASAAPMVAKAVREVSSILKEVKATSKPISSMTIEEYEAAIAQGTHTFDSIYRRGDPQTTHPFFGRSIMDADSLGGGGDLVGYHGVQFKNPLVARSKAEASQMLMGRNIYEGLSANVGEVSPRSRAILDADNQLSDAAMKAGHDAIVTPTEIQVINKAALPPGEPVTFDAELGVYRSGGADLSEGIGFEKARARAVQELPPIIKEVAAPETPKTPETAPMAEDMGAVLVDAHEMAAAKVRGLTGFTEAEGEIIRGKLEDWVREEAEKFQAANGTLDGFLPEKVISTRVNTAIEFVRAQKRGGGAVKVELDKPTEEGGTVGEVIADTSKDPASAAAEVEVSERIADAVDQLPPEERQTVRDFMDTGKGSISSAIAARLVPLLEERGIGAEDLQPIFGMGGAIPAEFALRAKSPTSIKNATVDLEREQRGLPPAVQPARRSFGEVWDQATRKIDEDQGYQERLINELRDKPRALTDLEDATLLQRQIDLQNEYNKATRDLAQAVDDARLDDVGDLQARVAQLSDRLLDLYNIGKKAGTETGRGLAARRMMVNEDFSLAALELQKRAAKGGERLTDTERTELQKVAADYKAKAEALEKKIAEREKGAAGEAVKTTLDKIVKEAKPKTKADATATVADATAKIKSKAGGDPSAITTDVQKLVRGLVEQGIKDRDVLVDAVHAVLKEADPEITRRDAADAISGYGKYKLLSKDEISVQVRDLKGQLQQVAKLEDMQAGQAPSKTGVERRTPSDEERRLIKQVEEAKKKGGYTVTDPATQLRSALQATQRRLENQIADLSHEIENRAKIVKEKAASPTSPEIEKLRVQRDKLREERDSILDAIRENDPVYQAEIEARKLNTQRNALLKSIAEKERKLREGDLAGKQPQVNRPADPVLESLKQKRDTLTEQIEKARDAAKPKRSPEEIALQAMKTRTTNRIAELEAKLKAGDFSKRVPREIKLDPEATKLKFELQQITRKYQIGLERDRLAQRTKLQVGFQTIGKTIRLIRNLITTGEFSVVLKQGAFGTFSHPIRTSRAVKAMFQSLRSERGDFDVFERIKALENYQNGAFQRSKLHLYEAGERLSKMDEAVMSEWAERIPIIKAFQRSFSAFLNVVRVENFDGMEATVARGRKFTPFEAELVANAINVHTGRGTIKGRTDSLVGLNNWFFAPRYWLSRLQLLSLQPIWHQIASKESAPKVRAAIALEYGRALLGIGTVITLAKMGGADFGTDRTSSDFGKLILPDGTRIDLFAGLTQNTVFFSRVTSGEKTTGKGKVQSIRRSGEKRLAFGHDDAADVTWHLLRTKLAPVPAAILNERSGSDVVGNLVTPASALLDLTVPITYGDIYQILRTHEIEPAVALSLLSLFGAGVRPGR